MTRDHLGVPGTLLMALALCVTLVGNAREALAQCAGNGVCARPPVQTGVRSPPPHGYVSAPNYGAAVGAAGALGSALGRILDGGGGGGGSSYPAGSRVCSDGRYCDAGFICGGGNECIRQSSDRVCSNGRSYCQSGYICGDDNGCRSYYHVQAKRKLEDGLRAYDRESYSLAAEYFEQARINYKLDGSIGNANAAERNRELASARDRVEQARGAWDASDFGEAKHSFSVAALHYESANETNNARIMRENATLAEGRLHAQWRREAAEKEAAEQREKAAAEERQRQAALAREQKAQRERDRVVAAAVEKFGRSDPFLNPPGANPFADAVPLAPSPDKGVARANCSDISGTGGPSAGCEGARPRPPSSAGVGAGRAPGSNGLFQEASLRESGSAPQAGAAATPQATPNLSTIGQVEAKEQLDLAAEIISEMFKVRTGLIGAKPPAPPAGPQAKPAGSPPPLDEEVRKTYLNLAKDSFDRADAYYRGDRTCNGWMASAGHYDNAATYNEKAGNPKLAAGIRARAEALRLAVDKAELDGKCRTAAGRVRVAGAIPAGAPPKPDSPSSCAAGIAQLGTLKRSAAGDPAMERVAITLRLNLAAHCEAARSPPPTKAECLKGRLSWRLEGLSREQAAERARAAGCS